MNETSTRVSEATVIFLNILGSIVFKFEYNTVMLLSHEGGLMGTCYRSLIWMVS